MAIKVHEIYVSKKKKKQKTEGHIPKKLRVMVITTVTTTT